jgi:hypothetical protein
MAYNALGLINTPKECDIVWERHFGNLTIAIDCDGRFVKRADYGNLTLYGWEIDHATPTASVGWTFMPTSVLDIGRATERPAASSTL